MGRQLRDVADAMRAAGIPLPDQLARALGLSDSAGTGTDGKGGAGAGARNGIKVSGGLDADGSVVGLSPASVAALEGRWGRRCGAQAAGCWLLRTATVGPMPYGGPVD